MRKVVLFFALILFGTLSFAGPFGLGMGMSLEEVTEACGGIKPEYLESAGGYIIKPIKSHSSFNFYIAWIDDNNGLYAIRACTPNIYSSEYGTELKTQFDILKERFSKNYGEPKVIDKVDKKSIWKDKKHWLHALREGARTLEANWGPKYFPDGLILINLKATTNTFDSGIILVEYTFSNYFIKSEDDIL